jgi:tetratricopeptide (TPR) repeat protein
VLALTLALLAQLTGAGWSSSRPAECAPLGEGLRGVSNVWERAKSPELGRYCDLLASGAAKLAGGAASGAPAGAREALAIADEADRAIPSRAAPSVLRGRALARLGLDKDALVAFEEGRRRDDRALEDPASLLAWARVLARAGRLEEASAAYRSLLPRASTLTVADRGSACIEAGLLASARGPSGLDEAIADLRQARRDSQEVIQAVATLALALALDRAGAREEARAVLGDGSRGDPRVTLSDARARELLTRVSAAAEADAMVAVGLEAAGEGTAAREAWKTYESGPSSRGPWAEHARAHAHDAASKRSGAGRGK